MVQNAWRHILYSIVAINFRYKCLIAVYFYFLEENDFEKKYISHFRYPASATPQFSDNGTVFLGTETWKGKG